MESLFQFIAQYVAAGLGLACLAALAALPLAAVVLLLDWTLGKRIPAKFTCLLWLLVVGRLVLPLAPPSPLGVTNWWWTTEDRQNMKEGLVQLVTALPEQIAAEHAVVRTARVQPTNGSEEQLAKREQVGVPETAPVEIFVGDQEDVAPEVDWETILGFALMTLWSLGFLLVLGRALIASYFFARKVRRLPSVTEPSVLESLHEVCRQLGVANIPNVKYVPGLESPALFGAWRSTLCLPEGSQEELTAEQLRLILLHEVAHISRRDALAAWLLTWARAFHWWNPVAWLAMSRVVKYRELACDEVVRQQTKPGERQAYGKLLLRYTTATPCRLFNLQNLGTVGLSFAKPAKQLTARIEAFTAERGPINRWIRPVLWSLIGLLMLAGLTDAAVNVPVSVEKPKRKPVFSFSGNTVEDMIASVSPETPIDEMLNSSSKKEVPEQREYAVQAAFEKLIETRVEIRTQEEAEDYLRTFLMLPGISSDQETSRHFPTPEKLSDGKTWKVNLTPSGHKHFAGILKGIEAAGPWQVSVETRIIFADESRMTGQAALGGIDWTDAVKFALPGGKLTGWPPQPGEPSDASVPADGLSLTASTITHQYAPYLAQRIEQPTLRRFVQACNQDESADLWNAPRVTLFSGTSATMHDQSLTPFVVGVQTIKGEKASAQQPEIAVLPEGMSIDLYPLVVDEETLKLNCRLVLSQIQEVDTTNLPGMEVTVQSPRVIQKAISARCTLGQEETPLIAAPSSGDTYYFAVTPSWFPDPEAVEEATDN